MFATSGREWFDWEKDLRQGVQEYAANETPHSISWPITANCGNILNKAGKAHAFHR